MSQAFPDPNQQRPRPLTPQERERVWTFRDKYYYSPRYTDDNYEYRHVVLPRELLKLIPSNYFQENGTFKLLTEDEWRGQLGITQSLGWVHYGCHAPEPHILLFRRPKHKN
ncbi:DEKNAAC104889 [Brettanomyces naardenensis]|uniref:Cyclin-dependent kinases regulatory subunit n=1 Tax=Brettanomyces naardenensis TaxID=13370 RepID=A0A448YS51_BRENA|nr:DEKNAAC104889 [Brettanomyces naardenensis]